MLLRFTKFCNLHWFIIVVFLIQIFVGLYRINEPLLDTRQHYYFNNAYFTSNAYASSFDPSLKGVIGTSQTSFINHQQVKEPISFGYYANHPTLANATLYSVFTRIFGYNERVPRLYALLWSLLGTFSLYHIGKSIFRSNILAALVCGIFICFPIHMIYQTTIQNESLGVYAICIVIAIFISVYKEKKIDSFWFYVSLFFFMQISWLGYFWLFFVIVVGLVYVYRSKGLKSFFIEYRHDILLGGASILLGFLTNIGILLYLKGGREPIYQQFLLRTATDGQMILTWGNRWSRQLIYIGQNFSWFGFTVSLLSCIYIIYSVFVNKNKNIEFGEIFVISTFLCSALYQLLFKNGSYIHVFWMYGFALCFSFSIGFCIHKMFTEKQLSFFSGFFITVLGIFMISSIYNYFTNIAPNVYKNDDIALIRSFANKNFDRFYFVTPEKTQLYVDSVGSIYYTGRPTEFLKDLSQVQKNNVFILPKGNGQQYNSVKNYFIVNMQFTEICSTQWCFYY